MTLVRIVVDPHPAMECDCTPPQGGPDPSHHGFMCPVAAAMHTPNKVVRVEEVEAS